MADTSRFDELFLGLASQSGGIEPMLHAVFSFLHRRTDFYVVKESGDPTARMGFDAGQAETILLRAFRAFPAKDLQGAPLAKPQPSSPVPLPAVPAVLSALAHDRATPSKGVAVEASEEVAPARREPEARPAAVRAQRKVNEAGKQVPVGNGGATERYVWTQTLKEATVHVPLPEGLRARDLDVALEATGLAVRRKRDGVAPLVEGQWPRRVQVSESVWTVDAGVLTVSLDKSESSWWSSAFVGDPEIDTSQVDSRAKVDDYDGETQGVIRKIMFDQQQRAKGLPTSEELQQQDIWDRAKYAPGSPFLPGGPMAGEEDTVTLQTAGGPDELAPGMPPGVAPGIVPAVPSDAEAAGK